MDCRLSAPLIGVLCLAALGAGCSLIGPDFATPNADLANHWLEKGDQRVRSSSAETRAWWRVFKDPVLNRLVEQAYSQNLPLRVAGLRILEARAQLGIAIGDFYPQQQHLTGLVEKFHLPVKAGRS